MIGISLRNVRSAVIIEILKTIFMVVNSPVYNYREIFMNNDSGKVEFLNNAFSL